MKGSEQVLKEEMKKERGTQERVEAKDKSKREKEG
jgi:hypothetical protein